VQEIAESEICTTVCAIREIILSERNDEFAETIEIRKEIHKTAEIPDRVHRPSVVNLRCPLLGVRVTNDDSEANELRHLRGLGICPNCGKRILAGNSVVRGAGSFCSLDCVASFHEAEFTERAKRLAAARNN
jgi:hypothetical protein